MPCPQLLQYSPMIESIYSKQKSKENGDILTVDAIIIDFTVNLEISSLLGGLICHGNSNLLFPNCHPLRRASQVRSEIGGCIIGQP